MECWSRLQDDSVLWMAVSSGGNGAGVLVPECG